MTTLSTPFLEQHKRAGAKLIEFAGFLMPVSYAGILTEHTAVRTAAGVFDVSHMGEFEVARHRTPGAFVDHLVTNEVGGAEVGPGRLHADVPARRRHRRRPARLPLRGSLHARRQRREHREATSRG